MLEELISKYDKEGKSDLGQQLRERLQSATAIDLEISLNWVGTADLDLFVTEPGGEKCSYKRLLTSNGGRLIQEDVLEAGADAKHQESYICHTAPSGDYEIAVRFVLGKAVAGAAVLEIIQHRGTPEEKRIRKTISLAKDDVVIKMNLEHGRRALK